MDERAAGRVDEAAVLVDAGRRVVVLSGAGMSTASGIPDFRGPKGVWTRNPDAEKLSSIDHYVADPEVRRRAWLMRLDSPAWRAVPGRGHRALVHLERRGQLDTLVTQNIDGLHQEAGTSAELVVEVHGTIREVVCLSCGWRDVAGPTLDRVRAGEADPHCLECDGLLKSATISFGQNLIPDDLQRAFTAAERCDVLLAVGSTLSVYPIAQMVPIARNAGADIVIVNGERTELDSLASVVVNADLNEALPLICGGVAPLPG